MTKRSVSKVTFDDKIFQIAPRCLSRYHRPSRSLQILFVEREILSFVIDGVAQFIWQKIDGKTPLRKIVAKVLREYDVSEAGAYRDARKLIRQLSEMGLIQEI